MLGLAVEVGNGNKNKRELGNLFMHLIIYLISWLVSYCV